MSSVVGASVRMLQYAGSDAYNGINPVAKLWLTDVNPLKLEFSTSSDAGTVSSLSWLWQLQLSVLAFTVTLGDFYLVTLPLSGACSSGSSYLFEGWLMIT